MKIPQLILSGKGNVIDAETGGEEVIEELSLAIAKAEGKEK